METPGLGGLDRLPTDLLNTILTGLNSVDACRLGVCSKILYGLTNSLVFWKKAYQADVYNQWTDKEMFSDASKTMHFDWKALYIKKYKFNNTRFLPIATEDIKERGTNFSFLDKLSEKIFISLLG